MYYYQKPMQQESKGLSIASLVIGIISLVSFYIPFIYSIVGLILGIVSIKKNKPGRGQAIAGIICSSIAILLSILFIVIMVSSANTRSFIWDSYRDYNY